MDSNTNNDIYDDNDDIIIIATHVRAPWVVDTNDCDADKHRPDSRPSAAHRQRPAFERPPSPPPLFSPNTSFFTAGSVFVSASSDVVLINIGSGAGEPTNCRVLIIYLRRRSAGEERQGGPRDEAAPSPAHLYKAARSSSWS